MTLNLEAIKARCEKATGDLTLATYAHGGGRLYVIGGPQSQRQLVADFYDEDNREFYYHARTDLPALVAEVERLRKVEAAAEALLGPWDDEWDCSGSPGHPQLTKAVVALRAALDAAQWGG